MAEVLQISLAAARVNAGLSQKDVSNKLHVSTQTIVNWENGKSVPSWKNLNLICELYKISIDNLRLPIVSN